MDKVYTQKEVEEILNNVKLAMLVEYCIDNKERKIVNKMSDILNMRFNIEIKC